MIKAIELYFDRAADQAVRHLWDQLARAGISNSMDGIGTVPHLSLVVTDNLPTAEVTPHLQELTRSVAPPTIALTHLGIFASGAIFLGVNASAALVEVHRRVTTAIQPIAQGGDSYHLPGAWVPHCTLAFGVAAVDLGPAAMACLPHQRPVHASITSIGLVEVGAAKVSKVSRYQWNHV